MELSHCAVSSEVSGHCLAFTSGTPKAQAGCPRAGGEVARPRAPPPGPKDPLHRDAQRPASPPCPAAPPASLESFEIKPARLSTPPQGSTVLCLANRPLCRQATRLSPAPGCTFQGAFQPGRVAVLHLPIVDFISYPPNSSALSQVRVCTPQGQLLQGRVGFCLPPFFRRLATPLNFVSTDLGL